MMQNTVGVSESGDPLIKTDASRSSPCQAHRASQQKGNFLHRTGNEAGGLGPVRIMTVGKVGTGGLHQIS